MSLFKEFHLPILLDGDKKKLSTVRRFIWLQMFTNVDECKKVRSISDSIFRMLKKKRASVIRKIMKFAKLANLERTYTTQLKTIINSLLKTLTDEQLDILLICLQSKGGLDADCICLTNDAKNLPRQTELRLAMAEAFRFPGVSKDSFLRNLTCCSQNNSQTSCDIYCLNPFHISLVVEIDSPLPPYTETQDITQLNLRQPIKKENLSSTASTANCTSSHASSSSSECPASHEERISDKCVGGPWCRLTYWERQNRIGPIFDAYYPCINVFENLPQGHGLCLSLLNSGNIERTDSSIKIRDSIGYGFQLTKEQDGVWLYNRSDIVLFVGSSTFQLTGVHQPIIKRIMPGNSILVYSPLLMPGDNGTASKERTDDTTASCRPNNDSEMLQTNNDTSASSNKVEPFCVRVSFGKGWGMNYTRMSISQCPCWIEMYLNL